MEPTRGSAKLGEYLRRLRKGYGFSLRRVEERAREEGGEIDNSQLSRYEKGRCYPSFDKLRILATIFNVPIQSFSDVIDLEKYEALKPGSADFASLREEGKEEMHLGHYGRAYVVFERCLEILEAGGADRFGAEFGDMRARCHYNMARALLRLGKINLSECEVRRMLRRSGGVNPRTKMMALILLSNVHREQGDRFLAIVDAEKCLAMANEGEDREIACTSHHAIGSAWYEEGDYEQAAESLRQALEGYRELGQREKTVTLLADIGLCDVALGKPKRGMREIQEAIRHARRDNLRRGLAYGLAKEGLAHYMLEDIPAARAQFQKAEIAAGRDEKYVDILFLCAYYQWMVARNNGNGVQEKISFGRLKHLRSSLERKFLEVQWFDDFIQGGKEANLS
jgi:transcriptional regulator with XRE-family HTH domain